MPLFCTECGIELDEHDCDANLATWGVFRAVCSDCVEEVDAELNPVRPSVSVWNGKVIYSNPIS